MSCDYELWAPEPGDADYVAPASPAAKATDTVCEFKCSTCPATLDGCAENGEMLCDNMRAARPAPAARPVHPSNDSLSWF